MSVNDDAHSESSWAVLNHVHSSASLCGVCDCDTKSDDFSWDALCYEPSSKTGSWHVAQSDASWEIFSDLQSLDGFDESSHFLGFEDCRPVPEVGTKCTWKKCCSLHVGTPFIELLRAGQFSCALSLLQTSPEPKLLAEQCDSSGDTALSWAVYKSSCRAIVAFEVVCQLLLLCPSKVKQRGSNTFLPLHDAAWGGAPSAIATLLCAAFPGALHDRAQRQSPHEVFWYHHSNSKCHCAWHSVDKMLLDALEIPNGYSSIDECLQSICSLRLSSVPEMHKMSAAEIQSGLNVSLPLANLFFDLLRATSSYAPFMASISEEILEGCVLTKRKRRETWHWCLSRRQRPPRGHIVPRPQPKFATDEIEYLREPSIKAGSKGVQRRRRAFKELANIMDGAGIVHQLSHDCMRRMPKKLRPRNDQQNWPSKKKLHCERAFERNEKSFNRGNFFRD